MAKVLVAAYVAALVVYVNAQGLFDCPVPWESYADGCYKFMLLPQDYNTAREKCEVDGASLVSVESRGEHDYISARIMAEDALNDEWYTSGQLTSDGVWRWESSGAKFEGDQFWINEEARKEDGDTLIYGWSTASTLGWSVGMRETETGSLIKRKYICEINKSQIYQITGGTRGYEYGSIYSDPLMYERGPHFVMQPHDVIYDSDNQDRFATLECEAEGNPDTMYKWYRTSEQKTVQISTEKDEHTIINGRLIIHDPQDTSDNGDYHCVAGNVFGSILSNTVQLSFGYLLDFPKSERDPVDARAFHDANIECNEPQHGYPYLYYSWFKGDHRNFIRPDKKPYTFISRNGKLYFSSVTSEDEGEYFCMVTKPNALAGKVSTAIQLRVSDTVASVREPQIASGFPTVFPSSPKRGEDIHMECFAMGTDELTYSWERIGAPMPETAVLSDHNRVLSIPNAELRHRGMYKCSVSRENGLSTSGTVQVPIEAAPFFTIPLKNQHLDQNQDLEWRCIGEGIPTVTYSWYRNATLLTNESLSAADRERYSIRQNVLFIKQVDKVRDSGMYQCGATNTHGTRYSSAQLRVLSFAPSFTKYPLLERMYGSQGGNVTIMCKPEGAPMPEKKWLKDGRPLQSSSKVEILSNGNLLLSKVDEDDDGNYTCVATNTHGTARNSTKLSIIRSMTISGPPVRDSVELGKTAFLRCEASYNPVLDITYDWYQNSYKIPFIRIKTLGQDQIYIERDDNFRRGSGINAGGLYIISARYENDADYTCVAKTTTVEVSAMAHLTVNGPPSQPAGVYGEGATSNSIILKWGEARQNGDTNMMEFYFETWNLDEGDEAWRPHPVKLTPEETKQRQVRLTGLDPWSLYRFRVYAVNKYGAGEKSPPSAEYQTLMAKPSRAPAWVGGGGGKVGTLVIQWTPVPREFRNGEKFGYVVKWKEHNNREFAKSAYIDKAEIDQHVVTLGKEYVYRLFDISVQVNNTMGMGPMYGEDVSIFTAEDLPSGLPQNVRASQINATALRVEWEEVPDNMENMNGKLKGYRINYWKDETEDEEMSIYNLVYGQRDYGDIIGLDPNTYYQVNVQVVNTAGNGPKSQDFKQRTLRAAPLYAPTEVKVGVLGYNSIRVKWRGVSTGVDEEPLEGYMVRIWRVGENLYVAKDYDAMRKSRLEIHDLDVDTLYNLRVYGYSRGGQGLMSSPGIQFYLRPFCLTLTEEVPDKDYIYMCRGQTDTAASLLPSLLLQAASLLVLGGFSLL